VKPCLLILSAPSGAGKTTISRALVSRRTDVEFSVSATTRTPRPGERDGVAYHFLTKAEFERRIEKGEFLEWAPYGGNLYGTLHAEVDQILGSGRHALLDIEIQGARSVRRHQGNVMSIFILPPSAAALIERLRSRRTEEDHVVQARLRRAIDEIAEAADYDYIVVNDELNRAVEDFGKILDAESFRPARTANVDELTRDLRDELAQAASQMAQTQE